MVNAIVLQAKIRDFKPPKNPDGSANSNGHPDFENNKAQNRGLLLGLVKSRLGADRKPQYAPSGATESTSGAAQFLQWYNAPVTTVYEIQLKPLPNNSSVYSYQNDRFFPLDDSAFLQAHPEFKLEQKWEEILDDAQGRRPSGILRNFHFTLEINTTFTYKGTEQFTFRGDDDLWVFIDGKLVIDLGGVHSPLQRSLDLSLTNRKNRAATPNKTLDILAADLHVGDTVPPNQRLQSSERLVLEVGKDYTLDLFFAERHTGGCRFRVDTSLLLVSPPMVSIAATDPTAAEQGLDPGEFTISLKEPAAKDLQVFYQVGGTATPGRDYQPLSGSVTIARGQTSAKIPVIPIDDAEIEAPETVIATLQPSADYQFGESTATVTIRSEDVVIPVATIVATDPTAGEHTDPIEFTVSLNAPAPIPLTIPYAVGGTATPGTDYHPLSGSVAIAQGQTTAKIPVFPINDAEIEAPETVILTLQPGQGYAVGNPATATAIIYSEDVVIPVATIAATDPTSGEHTDPAEFTVSLTVPAPANLTIPYTVGGTATPAADYQPLSGNVTIAQGQTSAKIPVVPINDAEIEAPETVVVTLRTGQGYAVGNPATATVIIYSEDVTATLPICSVKATHNARRPTDGVNAIPGEFTVFLNQTLAQPLTVQYTIAAIPPPNIVAVPGTDYQPLAGSVQIPANQPIVKIPVVPLPITFGNARPDNMTVTIALQTGAGYTLGTTTDTVLILLSTSPVPGPR